MSENRFLGRRKFLLGSMSVLMAGLFYKVIAQNSNAATQLPARTQSLPNPRLGVNLSSLVDWSTEQPFVDIFTLSRDWVSQKSSGGWGNGPELKLDEQGWVKELSPGCRATRIICSLEKGEYPSGEYVILYDGEGDLKPTFAGQIIKREPGRMVMLVNANKGTLALDLVSTNPQNHMRNIRMITPGFETSYKENPWRPEFLKSWAGVSCIRFMDFMATNNSVQNNWQSRPKVGDAGYSSKGAPVEMMVDLVNRLETDAWFCIPHQADDEYIAQFASYVKQHLKPNLRAWFEYSNEVWNGMFQQNQYAADMGKRLKFSDDAWSAAWFYTARRSVEIFKILDSVYLEEKHRVVKVLATQVANPYVAEQILTFEDAGKYADVLAIAPYIGLSVSTQVNEEGLSDKIVAQWSLDKVFEYLNAEIPRSKQWILDNKKVADRYGLKLVAYESGQHLVGYFGAENNQKLNELYYAANADKRMGSIYSKSLEMWEQVGGDLNCTFNSMSAWSKWGYWGLLQNYKENPKDSAKLNAVIQWAKSRGQKMNL